MRDALRRGMGKTTYEQVRQNFENRVLKGEFLTNSPTRTVGRMFTTPETVSAEREVIQRMRAGQGQTEPILSHLEAARMANQHSHLNTGQKTAIEHVLTSRDRVQGIQGVAGAGKTTALRRHSRCRGSSRLCGGRLCPHLARREAAWGRRHFGRNVAGLSGSRRQCRAERLNQKRLYFVDESSLTSTNQMKEFLNRLTPHDRVILVGDVRQHQAIEAGRPFEQLQDAGMSTAKLDQIVRQKDPQLKTAVEYLARGDVSEGIRALAGAGTHPRNRRSGRTDRQLRKIMGKIRPTL